MVLLLVEEEAACIPFLATEVTMVGVMEHLILAIPDRLTSLPAEVYYFQNE